MLSEPKISYKPFWGICRPLNSWRANSPNPIQIYCADFSFQPSINKSEIEDYTTLRFMENNENILFIRSSGTGKTHLATSIGIEAAKHRKSLYFITCQELMLQLKCTESENRLD